MTTAFLWKQKTHYGCIVGEMADGDAFAAGLDDGIQCVKLIG